MSELLLELFSEEIPSSLQRHASIQYKEIINKTLNEAGITFQELNIFTSPRRLALYLTGLLEQTDAQAEEIKGPKIDAHPTAIEGFCRSHSISKSQLQIKEIKDVKFYVHNVLKAEVAVKDILLSLLPQIILSYVWPKSMHWGDYNLRWIRPLRNIMCLFDNQILPIRLEHLVANDKTYGHRFMAGDSITIGSYKDYHTKLAEAFVIVDQVKRRSIILEQLEEHAKNLKVNLKYDEALLDEVTGLVEYPLVLKGNIPAKFLSIPSPVLVSALRTHQKYFNLFEDNGDFAPYFLFVSNIAPADTTAITSGNEKVLSARLSDALFFYQQDLKETLKARIERSNLLWSDEILEGQVNRVQRLKDVCKYLSPDNSCLQIAAELCKSDLSSEVVNEFPELQGVMGYYYAKHEGLSQEIALAIRDHYKPVGANDAVPAGSAAILALADKMLDLTTLIIVDKVEVTSSKDPYALRRKAIGIIRIILENKLDLDFREFIKMVINICSKQDVKDDQLISFFEERFKFYLKNQYDMSLISAVIDVKKNHNLVMLADMLEVLSNYLTTEKGAILITIYKRISNVLNGQIVDGEIDKLKFVADIENRLYAKIKDIKSILNAVDFKSCLDSLVALNDILTEFFDNLMVNDSDPLIARNRIMLLSKVLQIFDSIAKFKIL